MVPTAYSPGSGPTAIASIRSPGPTKDSVTFCGCVSGWHPSPRHKGHALDTEFDEERGADMPDAPELHLTWPNLHHRVDLAIDIRSAAAGWIAPIRCSSTTWRYFFTPMQSPTEETLGNFERPTTSRYCGCSCIEAAVTSKGLGDRRCLQLIHRWDRRQGP